MDVLYATFTKLQLVLDLSFHPHGFTFKKNHRTRISFSLSLNSVPSFNLLPGQDYYYTHDCKNKPSGQVHMKTSLIRISKREGNRAVFSTMTHHLRSWHVTEKSYRGMYKSIAVHRKLQFRHVICRKCGWVDHQLATYNCFVYPTWGMRVAHVTASVLQPRKTYFPRLDDA